MKLCCRRAYPNADTLLYQHAHFAIGGRQVHVLSPEKPGLRLLSGLNGAAVKFNGLGSGLGRPPEPDAKYSQAQAGADHQPAPCRRIMRGAP